jgi:thioredoxin 1
MEPSLSQEVLAQKYFEATEKDVKTSLIGKHKFALFFHAGWCPTCINMETEIKAGLKDLDPETKIAKVNYDSETVLKQELGITAQSTVIVFEKSGKIHEVLVSPNLEQIKTSLSEAK